MLLNVIWLFPFLFHPCFSINFEVQYIKPHLLGLIFTCHIEGISTMVSVLEVVELADCDSQPATSNG